MKPGAIRPAYMDREWFKKTNKGGVKPRMELTEKQELFLEFLLDPRKDKISQNEWSRQNEVPIRTVMSWKQNKLFREVWEKRSYSLYGGPEKVNRIVNAVFEKATAGDMKAAQLYLQYVDKFTPKKEIITETKTLADATDDELAELVENVVQIRRERTA